MKRPGPKFAPPKPLSHFATERMVRKEEATLWAHITPWQKQGFVQLRWSDQASFCHVKLTEAGRAEVQRLEATTTGAAR